MENNKEDNLEIYEDVEESNDNDKITGDINEEFEILPSDTTAFDFSYKVIVIGDSGVGKTCLTYRATNGEFRENMTATLGFEYFPFLVKYENKIIKLEIWDTCGQEAYRSLIKSFFNNSSLALIVYSVNNEKTFTSIPEWIMQCRSLCSPNTKYFLIGNKIDVPPEK